jgi:hypothetical protein
VRPRDSLQNQGIGASWRQIFPLEVYMTKEQITLAAFMKGIMTSCPDLSQHQSEIFLETFAPIFEFLKGIDKDPRLEMSYQDFMTERKASEDLHRHFASLYDVDSDEVDVIAFPIGSPEFVIEHAAWEQPDAWFSLMFENFMGNADPHKLDQRLFTERFTNILEAHKSRMFHPRVKQVLEKELHVHVSVGHWCSGHVSAWKYIATNERIALIEAVRIELRRQLEPYRQKNESFEIAESMLADAFREIYGALVFWAIGLIVDGYYDTDLCKAICGILKVYHKHPIVGANVHDPNLWMVLAH